MGKTGEKIKGAITNKYIHKQKQHIEVLHLKYIFMNAPTLAKTFLTS